MADSFHGEVPVPVWPDEDSHSPRTDVREPRHLHHDLSYKKTITESDVLSTEEIRTNSA